jgi:hypothetical protein
MLASVFNCMLVGVFSYGTMGLFGMGRVEVMQRCGTDERLQLCRSGGLKSSSGAILPQLEQQVL